MDEDRTKRLKSALKKRLEKPRPALTYLRALSVRSEQTNSPETQTRPQWEVRWHSP